MSKDTRITNAVRTLQANAIAPEFDSGYIRIYDGTRPAGPSTAISTQVLLAELRFASTAVASESNGVLTFGTITKDTSANATGTASWARLLKSDGTTAIADVSVGTSGTNIVLSTTSIAEGVEVDVTSASWTVAASSAA
jgi:hypothetical protein